MLSRQLVDLAASLCPANASMLLDQGYSLAVPVVPTSIYEHTLVARPNFKERCGAVWGGVGRANGGQCGTQARLRTAHPPPSSHASH